MKTEVDERPAWLLKRVGKVRSTNDLAKDLKPWEAVVAESQEAGRGRYGRRFVCGEGGVWLSAVVPMPGGPARWTGLALAVGWGLLEWLRGLSVEGARLRWPNDLMVGDRKLGGILLEQSAQDRCVVGVGINVFNDPAEEEPELRGIVTRLEECVEVGRLGEQGLGEVIAGVLEGVACGWKRMGERGLGGMVGELNGSWGVRRRVEIRPVEGEAVCGEMMGIDEEGAIVVALAEGGGRSFPAHWIERMVELG